MGLKKQVGVLAIVAGLSLPATGFGNARAPLYTAPSPVAFTQ